MGKICTTCLIDKDLSEFHKLKDKVRSQCKACRKLLTAKYRTKNREKLNKKQKDYYINNKKSRDNYKKEWLSKNKDKVKLYTIRSTG